MSAPLVQRIAEHRIRACCRRLPAELAAERRREWSAELPAIMDDQSIRPAILRSLRVLSYSLGVSKATRRLGRGAGQPRRARASGWRAAGIRDAPDNLPFRAAIGLIAWLGSILVMVTLARALATHGWVLAILLGPAACFVAFCLADIARADAVRYLPKWAWALICVSQVPSGGIAYLSVGRVGRTRPTTPGSAQP